MATNQGYVGLDESGNPQQQKPAKKTCGFWATIAIILICLTGIIIFAIYGADQASNNKSGSHSSSSNYVNTDGLIQTNLGKMQGNVLKDNDSDSSDWIYEFIGIRYGESMTGSNRFRPVIPYNNSWDDNTTYNATVYGASCPQDRSSTYDYLLYPVLDEDCLFLNIWTPYIPESSEVGGDSTTVETSKLKPVMLFIHGGSFVSGAGRVYNGTELVKEGGYEVVYVSINYRLGILGFLQHKELYAEGTSGAYGYNWPSYGGMNGLYDQITAIRWVRDQISAFGGDPDKITVFGESAGGLSTCMLGVSNVISDDLIYQMIIESGPCTGPWHAVDFEYSLILTEVILSNVTELGNINNLTVLREIDYEDLLTYAQDDSVLSGVWPPSIDMHVLTANATALYSDVSNIKVERMMWGFNSQDGLAGWPFFVGDSPKNETEYETFLMTYINNSTIVNEIMTTYYPISDFENNASIAWYGINGDLCIACPTFDLTNNILTQFESQEDSTFKQWLYEFKGAYSPFLAPHASELPYIFDYEEQYRDVYESIYKMQWNESLSLAMISAWNSFAQLTSNDLDLYFEITNYDGISNELFEWYHFGNSGDNNRTSIIFDNVINNHPNYKKDYRNGACPYWDKVIDKSVRKAICNNEEI